MSIQAIAWVLDHSEAEGHARLVLLAIANHADATGTNAYPSVDRIAREARVSRSTVIRCLAVLEDIGELVVVRDTGRRNQYVVPTQTSVSVTRVQGETSVNVTRVTSVTADTGPVSKRPKTSVTADTHNRSNRPLTENRVRARVRDVSAEYLDEMGRPLTGAECQRGKDAIARLREGLGR